MKFQCAARWKTLGVLVGLIISAPLACADEPWFVDVTEDVGLPGGGYTWVDYDGDGWVDLHTGNEIYRNENGKKFIRVASVGPQGIWADYDNDGDPDLFSWIGTGNLVRNNGDGTFSEAKSGLPDLPTVISLGATWTDLNGDGFLDLYVGGFESENVAVHPDTVYVNKGDGTFGEHQRNPSGTHQEARGVTAADFDEDGDMDIYVSNYRLQPNLLWRVDKNLVLTEIGFEHGVAGKPTEMGWSYPACGHTIGSAFGDLDNDGHLDLFVGNFSHPPEFQNRPMFLRNQGPPDYHFEDKSAQADLRWQESYASPVLGDFDNDGNLDLYFTTVYPSDHCVLYRNEGNWRFTDATATSGINTKLTYQAACADYDNDGDLDLLTAGKLYQNRGPKHHWLKVRLVGPGSAIGAQVRIRVGDRVLTRQVESSTGQGNQNDMTLHFGLGDFADAVPLEVSWPLGARHTQRTEVDRTITIRHP